MSSEPCSRAIAHGRSRAYPRCAAAVLCALLCVLPISAAAGPAAWQDPMTGLAIGGYDPLAYYTQGEPGPGSDDHELNWGGAVWRFMNSGNLDAFRRDPEVYAPRFAGYDPYAIATGRTTRGLPSIWVRDGDSIFLFHNAANRHLWIEDRDALLETAERKWLELADTLPRPIGLGQ